MRGWLFVGQKCTRAIPSPSRLYTVTMSSIPDGDSVSIKPVLETIDLKLVFTGWPFSSFPSHSPASLCSFLKAAAEWEAARSGVTLKVAAAKKRAVARVLMDGFLLEDWVEPAHLRCWTRDPRKKKAGGNYGFRDMAATSMIGVGSLRIARTNASTIFASNWAFAQRCYSASASAEARAFL